jgi:acetyl esterase/lipase
MALDRSLSKLTELGGGFVYPASTQFQFVYDIQQEAGNDTAGVILSYSLAPGKQYPHQLRQAVALIFHLVTEAGKKPENIIIVGDSAGANLALAVFSHMLHPHPDSSIPRLDLGSPLKGALLVSPWTSLETSAGSYMANRKRDCVDQSVLQKWGGYYIGSAPPDPYNQPLVAPDKWWLGLDEKVSEILMTAGTNESMFDDTQSFSQKLKVSDLDMSENWGADLMPNQQQDFPHLETLFSSGETHDQMFMDPLIGVKEESATAKGAKSWILARL